MTTKNTISLYWKCQLAGWIAASLYWSYAAFTAAPGFNIPQGIADFVLDVIVGILLTHSYRLLARRAGWNTLPLNRLVWVMILAVPALSAAYTIAIISKLYLVRRVFVPAFSMPYAAYFGASGLTVFITGTRLMSIWVLAYHLYHYALREIQSARENARLQVVAKEAQLHNLFAQLNPHFFFNSLANIKFLVNDNPAAARRAIDLLSDLMRHSLYGKNDQLVPLQQEMDFVKDYLELASLRFEERLQVQVTMDEQLADVPVPPFCIQTLVENAIKHGIERTTTGGLVAVCAARKETTVIITVQNPGRWQAAEQTGLGLKNLQERLQLHYNGSARFTIEERTAEVIAAAIIIPI